jgi:hypothetical protein
MTDRLTIRPSDGREGCSDDRAPVGDGVSHQPSYGQNRETRNWRIPGFLPRWGPGPAFVFARAFAATQLAWLPVSEGTGACLARPLSPSDCSASRTVRTPHARPAPARQIRVRSSHAPVVGSTPLGGTYPPARFMTGTASRPRAMRDRSLPTTRQPPHRRSASHRGPQRSRRRRRTPRRAGAKPR